MVTLVMEKVVILGGMFLSTLCFGLFPLKLVAYGTSEWMATLISLSSCFSGGVFLAACLLDLLPDVHQSIDNVLNQLEDKYRTKIDYPVSEFIIVMGLFVVLIIEQSVLFYKEERAHVVEEAVVTEDGDEDTPLLVRFNNRGHTHGHDHAFEHSALRAYLLLIALSFHSLFEGLAIGLQDQKGQLISIFSAVILHKSIMAFALGLNLAQSQLTKPHFALSVLIFSLASPIGMGLGIGLMDLKRSLTRDAMDGILQGMSCGTFLYITFFEVLPNELNKPTHRLQKVLCVIFGFSSICGLLFITH